MFRTILVILHKNWRSNFKLENIVSEFFHNTFYHSSSKLTSNPSKLYLLLRHFINVIYDRCQLNEIDRRSRKALLTSIFEQCLNNFIYKDVVCIMTGNTKICRICLTSIENDNYTDLDDAKLEMFKIVSYLLVRSLIFYTTFLYNVLKHFRIYY